MKYPALWYTLADTNKEGSARVYQEAGYFNLKYRLAADYEFMLRTFKTFSFKINSQTNKIDFIIIKTLLSHIENTTYDKYDDVINADIVYKNNLITLCYFMIKNMNCSIDKTNIN